MGNGIIPKFNQEGSVHCLVSDRRLLAGCQAVINKFMNYLKVKSQHVKLQFPVHHRQQLYYHMRLVSLPVLHG